MQGKDTKYLKILFFVLSEELLIIKLYDPYNLVFLSPQIITFLTWISCQYKIITGILIILGRGVGVVK